MRLEGGEVTRVSLKRQSKFPEKDVEDAIQSGEKHGILKVLKHGYVQRSTGKVEIYEEDYYDSILEMLNSFYRDAIKKSGDYIISKTARKDTKIAGRWTRPDFTVVSSRKFPYIRENEFDIITFEVKRPVDCEAIAVFEALAHNSAATRSYVFFPITEGDLSSNPQGDRIREECVRHGIGLFLVKDRFKLNESHIFIESQRRPLNPEKCSQFLQNVLNKDELSTLTTW